MSTNSRFNPDPDSATTNQDEGGNSENEISPPSWDDVAFEDLCYDQAYKAPVADSWLGDLI